MSSGLKQYFWCFFDDFQTRCGCLWLLHELLESRIWCPPSVVRSACYNNYTGITWRPITDYYCTSSLPTHKVDIHRSISFQQESVCNLWGVIAMETVQHCLIWYCIFILKNTPTPSQWKQKTCPPPSPLKTSEVSEYLNPPTTIGSFLVLLPHTLWTLPNYIIKHH